MSRDRLTELAESLEGAWQRAEAIPAPTSVRPETTLEEAYTIQDRVIDIRLAAGRQRSGWKMGLTSSPDATPIVGTLLDDMVVDSGVHLDPASMVSPLIEGELAFVVGEPIPAGADASTIAGGRHQVAPAIEVIDYRTTDPTGVVDWVADNSTVAYAVLGPRRDLAEIEPLDSIEVDLLRGDDVIARGDGALVMGDPLRAVAWLVAHLESRGQSLVPGAVVLTGSLTGHHEVRSDSSYRAVFTGLGEVSVHFPGGN